VLALLAFVAAARSDVPAEFELLTVNGAKNIQHHEFPDAGGRGLSYTIRLAYPNMAVDRDRFRQLHDRSWSECGGTRTQWDSHIEIDGGLWSCVHEFGKYFIKDSSLMLVSLKYRSKLRQQSTCPSRPSNKTQIVAAVIYEHPDRNTLQSAIQRLGLSCGIPQ
jgi:hypothetical protein